SPSSGPATARRLERRPSSEPGNVSVVRMPLDTRMIRHAGTAAPALIPADRPGETTRAVSSAKHARAAPGAALALLAIVLLCTACASPRPGAAQTPSDGAPTARALTPES